MAEYYAQRASAGLIITEGAAISEEAYGWQGSPGIYTSEHRRRWSSVADAVQGRRGTIFMQLWHCGRASHPDFQPNGLAPVAPSAIPIQEGFARTPAGKKPWTTPRALTIDEIHRTVHDYRDAALRARDAGFDGVELHAANGYLIDEFLRDGANKRTDDYGGSVANRARFLLEICEAISKSWEGQRLAVRLSPGITFNSMSDSDPEALFCFVAEKLNAFNLAYLHIYEPAPGATSPIFNGQRLGPQIRSIFKGTIIRNGEFNAQSAAAMIQSGEADLVSFGRLFISNPDLPARFANNASLQAADPRTFYTPGPAGYTDYPLLA